MEYVKVAIALGSALGTVPIVLIMQTVLRYYKEKQDGQSLEKQKDRKDNRDEFLLIFDQLRSDITDLKKRWEMSMARELECEKRFAQIHEDHTKLWRLFERTKSRMVHLEELLRMANIKVSPWKIDETEEHSVLVVGAAAPLVSSQVAPTN